MGFATSSSLIVYFHYVLFRKQSQKLLEIGMGKILNDF